MRARIQIGREQYQNLSAYFMSIACHRSVKRLSKELCDIPFEPYAPVRKQLLNILRHVNSKRQSAGYEKIPTKVFRYKRRIVSPFESPSQTETNSVNVLFGGTLIDI